LAKALDRDDFTYGQFGENFRVEGLADTEMCIGDHYWIGDALFEVTQPRVTCYRVGIRMNEPQMAALLVSHGRPGSISGSWKKAKSAPATKS
jgi:MOSC domain-containing protein YiiM